MSLRPHGHGLTIAAVVVSCSLLIADCHSSTSPSGSDSTPPVLSAAIIDLAQLTDFLPFGASLGDHQNPAYELYTGSDTLMVQAASPGSVDVIEANPAPQTDFEIRIRPSAQSIYLLIYDHIVAPQVSVGQTVSAGQTLGQIGPFNDHGRNRNGRVEIQINRGTGADTMAICPRNFGTADFNALHAAAFLRFPGQGIDICIGETVKP